MHEHSHLTNKPWEFRLARGAAALVAGLQFFMVNDFSFGPRWLAPLLEIARLIPLSFATPWTMNKAARQHEQHIFDVGKYRRNIRTFAIVLTALVTFMNVIAFALWFWNIDRGGPALRGLGRHQSQDFLFPQYALPTPNDGEWSPGFVDYVFLSFTNATAFSPTDTLPLSQRAKLLMMAQAAISLLVVALVAARAVNILA